MTIETHYSIGQTVIVKFDTGYYRGKVTAIFAVFKPDETWLNYETVSNIEWPQKKGPPIKSERVWIGRESEIDEIVKLYKQCAAELKEGYEKLGKEIPKDKHEKLILANMWAKDLKKEKK